MVFPVFIAGSALIQFFYVLGLLEPLSNFMAPLTVGWLKLPLFAGVLLIVGIVRKEFVLVTLVSFVGTDLSLALNSAQFIVLALVGMLYLPCLSTLSILIREFGLKAASVISIEMCIRDRGRADNSMPKNIENAKIALLKYPIEVKDLETDAKIKLTDPTQMQAFIEQEEQMVKEMVDKIVQSGANVLFCQKGIDDLALHLLAREGIIAVKRVRKSDMERLGKATGCLLYTSRCV